MGLVPFALPFASPVGTPTNHPVRGVSSCPRTGLLGLYKGDTVEVDGTTKLRSRAAIDLQVTRAIGRAGKTIYYVRKDGSNTAPYDTEAKGATTINAVLDYLGAGNGSGSDLIDIGAGTWEELISITDADLNGVVIVGAGMEQTVVSGSGAHTVLATSSLSSGGFTLADMTITTTSVDKYCIAATDSAGEITLQNLKVVEPNAAEETIIWLRNCAIKMRGCIVVGSSARDVARYGVQHQTGTGTNTNYIDIDGCVFVASGDKIYAPFIRITTNGSNIIRNSVILGSTDHGVYFSAASGTCTIENNIIMAGQNNTLRSPIYKGSGTVVARNNQLICSRYDDEGFLFTNGLDGGDTDENNVVDLAPVKFVGPMRGGYLLPAFDDTGALVTGYLQEIVTLFQEFGVSGTWNCNIVHENGMTEEWYPVIRGLVSSGALEIANHGRTHANLTHTHGLNFSHSTGTDPTVTYDGETITLSCTEPENSTTIDVTGMDTLGEIVALSGAAGWTIDYSTTDDQVVYAMVQPYIRIISLATLEETAAPCDIDYNRSGIDQGFFKDQIVDGKTEIEAVIGELIDPQTGEQYQCRSYCATYNQGNLETLAMVKAAGHETYRWRWGEYYIGDETELTNIDFFRLHHGKKYFLEKGTDEVTIKKSARLLGMIISYLGVVPGFLSHTYAEFSIDQWRWTLEVLTEEFPDIKICSVQQFLDDVRASGLWTEGEDNKFTRTFDLPDLHLDADSPLLYAGIDPYSNGDGDQYDIEGYKVWDDTYDEPDGYMIHGWHIGAYSKTPFPLYYHLTINSGTDMDDYEFTMPPSIAAAISDEVVDATDRASMSGPRAYWGDKAGLMYEEDQTGKDDARAERYCGL